MRDTECIAFLQWALPKMGFRWPGFRKVRGQVCKRVGRRLKELGLADLEAYREYLEVHPDEWAILDGFCRITISRFFRDRDVYETLGSDVLPELARRELVWRGQFPIESGAPVAAPGRSPTPSPFCATTRTIPICSAPRSGSSPRTLTSINSIVPAPPSTRSGAPRTCQPRFGLGFREARPGPAATPRALSQKTSSSPARIFAKRCPMAPST